MACEIIIFVKGNEKEENDDRQIDSNYNFQQQILKEQENVEKNLNTAYFYNEGC